MTCVAYSNGVLSARASPLLTVNPTCRVAGWIVMPAQLRKPVATTFIFVPSGLNDRTFARNSSVSHVEPSGLVLTHSARPLTRRGSGYLVTSGAGNMSSATFDPEPAE